MATLTLRDLDERLKDRVRIRAAMRGRSMEEKARQRLRGALDEAQPASGNVAERIRRRFSKLGDVKLVIPARETQLADEADAA